MATHVKVIAAFYLAIGTLLASVALFVPLLMALLAKFAGASAEGGGATGATLLGFAGIAASGLLLTFALPYLATGWGLLQFRPWARILGIVLGALCLVQIPFGLLLGAYALVILFRKDTAALFVAAQAHEISGSDLDA